MKSILLSIKPKYVELIASGQKTIEVRKTAPQEVPFKCYIYESRNGGHRCKHCNEKDSCYSYAPKNVGCYNGRGKVIGEFICDKVYPIKNQGSRFSVADEEQSVTNEIARQSCLYYDDMVSYFGNKDGFGWHISDLKIYNRPKELSEFRKPCDWNYDCCTCRRLVHNEYMSCDNKITRPPLSWCYVEDLGEEE